MALRIVQIEEIQNLLRESSSLVRLYESQEASFLTEANDWLCRLESTLEKNRLHVVSRVANLRGLIVAARRGVQDPSIHVASRASRRKVSEAVALKAVRESCEAIDLSLANRLSQIDEAERITKQIVAAALAKRLFDPELTHGISQQVLERYRQLIAAQDDLLPYYVALTALVTQHDMLILIDRSIGELAVHEVE